MCRMSIGLRTEISVNDAAVTCEVTIMIDARMTIPVAYMIGMAVG